jgi:aspartate aminotransferase
MKKSEDIQKYISLTREIHLQCSKFLHQKFIEMGLECTEPEGAFYLMVNFEPFREKLESKGISNAVDLTHYLLNQFHIAMLPGTDFYMPEWTLTCRVATVDYDGEKALEAAYQGQEIDVSFIEKYCTRLPEVCQKLVSFLKTL